MCIKGFYIGLLAFIFMELAIVIGIAILDEKARQRYL